MEAVFSKFCIRVLRKADLAMREYDTTMKVYFCVERIEQQNIRRGIGVVLFSRTAKFGFPPRRGYEKRQRGSLQVSSDSTEYKRWTDTRNRSWPFVVTSAVVLVDADKGAWESYETELAVQS